MCAIVPRAMGWLCQGATGWEGAVDQGRIQHGPEWVTTLCGTHPSLARFVFHLK